jgi:hypothetical protein
METLKTFVNVMVVDFTTVSRHLLVGKFHLIETIYLPQKREARIEYSVFKDKELIERVATLDNALNIMIANGYEEGDTELA